MEISKFNFNGKDLNVFLDENNRPLFLGSQVCELLTISNSSDSISRLDDDEKLISVMPISGQNRNVILITESGLYSLILKSRKKEAKIFKKWVTSEVLPSIRKHGAYMTSNTIESLIQDPQLVIELATKLKEERRINEENKQKVLFAESLEISEDSILIGHLSKLLNQKGLDIGQNRLFEWMRNNGYLCTTGNNRNLPTQKSMDMKLFEIKTTTISTSEGIRVTQTTKVTGKGQIYFINKLNMIKNEPRNQ